MPKYKTLKFSSFEKQQRRPFTIYADTEALLIPKEHVDPSHHKDSAKGEEESEEDLHLEEIADVLGFNKEEVEEILDPDYDVVMWLGSPQRNQILYLVLNFWHNWKCSANIGWNQDHHFETGYSKTQVRG